MIFSFVFGLLVTAGTWLLGLLPEEGCGVLDWGAIDVGIAGIFVDLAAIQVMFAIFVGFEVAMMAYRLAIWVWDRAMP